MWIDCVLYEQPSKATGRANVSRLSVILRLRHLTACAKKSRFAPPSLRFLDSDTAVRLGMTIGRGRKDSPARRDQPDYAESRASRLEPGIPFWYRNLVRMKSIRAGQQPEPEGIET